MALFSRVNQHVHAERRLLQRCAAGDASAQAEFRLASYVGHVFKVASRLNAEYHSTIPSNELDALCRLWITEIWRGHEVFPHSQRTLYTQIELYVLRAFQTYLSEH